MILKTLQNAGVTGQYKIADGSGLSLYNYVTVELLVTLLRHAWRTPSISKALMPSGQSFSSVRLIYLFSKFPLVAACRIQISSIFFPQRMLTHETQRLNYIL